MTSILFVDDDERALRAFQRAFESPEYQVTITTGTEPEVAVATASSSSPMMRTPGSLPRFWRDARRKWSSRLRLTSLEDPALWCALMSPILTSTVGATVAAAGSSPLPWPFKAATAALT